MFVNRKLVQLKNVITKAVHKCSAISNKIPKVLFIELGKTILKFVCTHKRLQVVKVSYRTKT